MLVLMGESGMTRLICFYLQATRQLRTMGVKTPIIALTGNSLQSDRELFFEAGVDDFQTKVRGRCLMNTMQHLRFFNGTETL